MPRKPVEKKPEEIQAPTAKQRAYHRVAQMVAVGLGTWTYDPEERAELERIHDAMAAAAANAGPVR